jgi:salicylate hydroxylase
MTLKSHSVHLLLYLFSFSVGVKALSLNGRRPAKRVAIIGTGIAGLSVAHALTNSPLLEEEYGSFNFEVSMFEARKKLDTKAGAGVQLNGGLAALGKINGKVQRAVLDAGLPVSHIKSCSKPWSSSKPFEVLLQLDLEDIVKKAGGEISQNLIQDGELLWSAIMRGCLQDTLWKTLPSATRRGVKFNKALIDMKPQSDGSVMCTFSDGTSAGPFDLVVGSDGIKSACKEYIETGKISADPSNRQGKSAALYSGIRIKYAVDDEWTPKDGEPKSAVLKQYFGDGANVLDGTYGNGEGRQSKIAFFVFLDKDYRGPFRRKEAVESAAVPDENVDWREGERRNHEFARKAMSNGVHEFNIPSIDVDPTVSAADRFFELGVYFHNPFSLEGWSKKVAGKDSAVVVLCGDAAVSYSHSHVHG